jgi:hypothetical protein
LLDGFVSLVVGGFQFRVGLVGRMGLVVESAVGQWPTQTLVKKEKQ